MSIDSLIIVITILHAYVFAIMLFARNQAGSRVLGFFMVNFFIQSFLFANFHIFHIESLHVLFYLGLSSLSLLEFPLIYLYVRYMSDAGFKLTWRQALHFLPAFVIFVCQVATYLSLEPATKTVLLASDGLLNVPELSAFNAVYSISIIILFIQVFAYSTVMIIRLIKHKKNIENYYSYKHKISLRWLLAFVILYLAYYIVEIIIYSFLYLKISETAYFSILAVHIFFVGIFGLRQKEIFDPEHKKEEEESFPYPVIEKGEDNTSGDPIKEQLVKEVEQKAATREKQELLSDDMKKMLADKITGIIESEQLYLDDELSLNKLAEQLEIHKNYVSHVINNEFNVNFYNFINKYRIEEAKRLLADEQYDHYSIEGIAKSCGFKSRNVFYPIFKKHMGMTPREFKNKIQQPNSQSN
jgi:AraC-like DNA-binding protein